MAPIDPLLIPRAYVSEYRILGAKSLPRIDVEEAVYPYLGPARTEEDLQAACTALVASYKEKGYEVSVQATGQIRRGVVTLQVTEVKLGRLRVKGSRFFLPNELKSEFPSLVEGQAVNYQDFQRDLAAAVQRFPDRQIELEQREGSERGTLDIDLKVKDTFPLHGSIALNNRYSPDTTELRLDGSISYNNLWQRNHSVGFSFQVSPQDLDEVKVLSAFYTARFRRMPWLELTIQGIKNESNVSTLGGIAVAGRGDTLGARATFRLPELTNYNHSVLLGIDYKTSSTRSVAGGLQLPGENLVPLEQELDITAGTIRYLPIIATYQGSWITKQFQTDLSGTLVGGIRGIGSEPRDFDERRFGAKENFYYFRGDLSHTHELPRGFQLFALVQGQLSPVPLVDAEQFAIGGINTVRGYREAEELGDNALAGTLELRSPSLLGWIPQKTMLNKDETWNEVRVFAFLDAGFATIRDPLPEQRSHFELASWGVGAEVRLLNFVSGAVIAGFPLIETEDYKEDMLLSFRASADF